MAISRETSVHDSMIESVMEYMRAQGFFNITANLPGIPLPEKIYKPESGEYFIPDLIADRKGEGYIFDVETEDTLDDIQTAKKWKLFSAYAEKNNKVFHIVVPGGMLVKVDRLLSEHKLTAVVHQINFNQE